MVRAIFFDLDDTVLWDEKSLKVAFEATCKTAEERYGLDPDRLEVAVRETAQILFSPYETYPFTEMIGISALEGLWGDFFDKQENITRLREIVPGYRKYAWSMGLKKMGIDDPDFGYELAELFPKERRKAPFVYEETFKTLDVLKENYQLLLLTNGSPDLQMTKLAITPGLISYFDKIVISGNFGKGKPDPSIFTHALSLMELTKDKVIMIGDNLMTDILGANRAGIKSVWINRDYRVRNEVKPSYEIQHLEELFPILEGLNSQ